MISRAVEDCHQAKWRKPNWSSFTERIGSTHSLVGILRLSLLRCLRNNDWQYSRANIVVLYAVQLTNGKQEENSWVRKTKNNAISGNRTRGWSKSHDMLCMATTKVTTTPWLLERPGLNAYYSCCRHQPHPLLENNSTLNLLSCRTVYYWWYREVLKCVVSDCTAFGLGCFSYQGLSFLFAYLFHDNFTYSTGSHFPVRLF